MTTLLTNWLRKREERQEAALRELLGLTEEDVEAMVEAWRELIDDPESYAP